MWLARGVLVAASSAFLLGGALPALAQKPEVVVFAAASLKNALDAATRGWEKDRGVKATISYASSSALAKQIEQGAPAALFISADLDWMDYLAGKGLIEAASRSNLLGNSLVLIVPKGAAAPVEIGKGFDLAKLLGGGRLAVGEVSSVPAGKYAKAALESLGIWPSVADRLAQAENVRAALALVSRREAAAGIVYKTDAAADTEVSVIGTFPEGSHPEIVYPIALVKGASSANAAALLDHLKSDKAKAAFEAQGFTVLE